MEKEKSVFIGSETWLYFTFELMMPRIKGPNTIASVGAWPEGSRIQWNKQCRYSKYHDCITVQPYSIMCIQVLLVLVAVH